LPEPDFAVAERPLPEPDFAVVERPPPEPGFALLEPPPFELVFASVDRPLRCAWASLATRSLDALPEPRLRAAVARVTEAASFAAA
ncbi:MAG TPA: hypothetical protein VFP55_08295, partial [Solirubrobacteraceae bacterium]|nr:hypothetical protein [Solirubrobacteraceae bacterium]